MADTRYPNVIPAKAGIESNLSESLVGYFDCAPINIAVTNLDCLSPLLRATNAQHQRCQ
jgi:hypothetical protein